MGNTTISGGVKTQIQRECGVDGNGSCIEEPNASYASEEPNTCYLPEEHNTSYAPQEIPSQMPFPIEDAEIYAIQVDDQGNPVTGLELTQLGAESTFLGSALTGLRPGANYWRSTKSKLFVSSSYS